MSADPRPVARCTVCGDPDLETYDDGHHGPMCKICLGDWMRDEQISRETAAEMETPPDTLLTLGLDASLFVAGLRRDR